jgi:ribonucleoside-diphosphate reductase alpha chain|tara:strand:- start:2151 stop:4058 length:1908 start_codon:yes stop_codon:yes gene_type:complete
MNLYQEYIHKSRYARYRDDLGRRETWDETVDRVGEFWKPRLPEKLKKEFEAALSAVRTMDVMPSMRVMMSAGKALDDHNVAGYNCAYVPVDDPKVFSEIVYVLMCGTGVGFSVERDQVNKLPAIPDELAATDTIISVRDSKLGWASAYRELVSLLYGGLLPSWDLSKIRPAGSRLRTFGGRASGPAPLNDLFQYTVETFKGATGRQLTTLEVHDVVCKIADIVVVGGVRRSALISLSNLSDDRLRGAKGGQWWNPIEEGGAPQRRLANNSVAYTGKPDVDSFMSEMVSLYRDKNGERGIFNRAAAKAKYKEHRREEDQEWGCNPCSEILLRPAQFCNLTEVIVRPKDTLDDLKEKIKHATLIGTLQASLTDFKFISKRWKTNCEEEALLGVSLTGCCDHPLLSGYKLSAVKEDDLIKWLLELKAASITHNEYFAKVLGINKAAAITCVKPSGTVSQLCDTASGIHPRFSPYYIRRVRNDKKDPLTAFLKDSGVPWEDDQLNNENVVFSFPTQAPMKSLCVDNVDAVGQLETWQLYNDYYTEHKPSVTIYYGEEEFLDVCSYVWNNFDSMSGIAFLPKSDHTYQQAPYEEIDKESYLKLSADMPGSLNWEKLADYENEDNTSVQPELACSANGCEI